MAVLIDGCLFFLSLNVQIIGVEGGLKPRQYIILSSPPGYDNV